MFVFESKNVCDKFCQEVLGKNYWIKKQNSYDRQFSELTSQQAIFEFYMLLLVCVHFLHTPYLVRGKYGYRSRVRRV